MGNKTSGLRALPLFFLAACRVFAQRETQEPVDICVHGDIRHAAECALQIVSTRTGERVLQDFQVRVTRRNNKRPVGAGLLVRAHIQPSNTNAGATFGRATRITELELRTDENGMVHVNGLVANEGVGSYYLVLEINDVQQGVRYEGSTSVQLINVKPPPFWLFSPKTPWIIGGGIVGLIGICYAVPSCRPGGGPAATVTFGPGRVGP